MAGGSHKKVEIFPVWEMMEGGARLSWKRQPRIILVIFILSRERQEPEELQASEGALGSQGTRGQRGHWDGLASKGRRYVWDCPPRERERCCLWTLPMPWLCPTQPGMLPWIQGLMFWGPRAQHFVPTPFGGGGVTAGVTSQHRRPGRAFTQHQNPGQGRVEKPVEIRAQLLTLPGMGLGSSCCV